MIERPAALVSEAPWRHARTLAQTLASAGSSYYLECRLGASSPDRLDVLIGVGHGARHRLERWLSTQTAALDGLRRVAAAWSRDAEGPMHGVSSLWLEYDRVDARSAERSPAISACLLPSYDDSYGLSSGEGDGESARRALAVLETLMGRPMGLADQSRFERCWAHLPARARVIHTSVMLGRAADPAKLYIVMPRNALCEFLAGVGWRGDITAIEHLLQGYCPVERVADELYVDITFSSLHAAGGNLLGVVFSPQHLMRATERDPGRAPLLDACVRAGLCSDVQRAALRAWPGERLLPYAPALDPDAEDVGLLVEQWLDLKLVWSPCEALALKGYLGQNVRVATRQDRARLQSAFEPSQIALGASQEQARTG